MAESLSVPIDIGGLEQYLGQIDKAATGTAKSADKIKKAFRDALAAEVLAGTIGQVADVFDGATKQTLEFEATLIRAAGQAGIAGAAMAALGLVVSEGVKTWRMYADEATRAERAVDEEVSASEKRIGDLNKQLAESAALARAYVLARREGLSVEEAQFALSRRQLDIDIQNRKLMIEGQRRAIAFAEGETKALLQNQLRQTEQWLLESEAKRSVIQADGAAKREKKRTEESQRALAAAFKAVEDEARAVDDRDRQVAQDELDAEAERAFVRRDRAADERRRLTEQERLARQGLADQEVEIAADQAERERGIRAENLRAQAALEEEAFSLEAQRREALNQALLSAGEDLVRSAADFVLGEDQRTKKQYEEAAKRAALEAAIQTAMGFATSILNPPEAATHFIAAAKFAAIAAGSGIAAANTSGGGGSPSASGGAAPPSGAAFPRSPGGSRGGGERPAITVVLPSGGVLLTRAETSQAVAEALREAERRA